MSEPNMKKFDIKTKWPKTGDIFEVRVKEYRCPGRVVSTTVKAFSGSPIGILFYVFNPVAEDWTVDDRTALSTIELLVPPMITNKKPWTLHYFRTLKNSSFLVGEILPKHRFEQTYNGKHVAYYDEDDNKVTDPSAEMGPRGIESYLTIDDTLSQALGLPLAL